MEIHLTKEELIAFEKEIEQLYINKKISSPVHASGGNEEQLIALFKNIQPEDWIFATYRNHYHALLKGMPRDKLLQEVLANHSIHIMSKEYRFVTSSIVGGTISQAIGAAMAIKLKQERRHVWVFCGEMAGEGGTFYECTKYARRHKLPITFIIEDNGWSVDTPTQKVWGEEDGGPNVLRYRYERIYPHYGFGVWVVF
ncbi:MAG: thiamine pyrophosphate-dependent enzyme [Nanoarchaeota archaeon]